MNAETTTPILQVDNLSVCYGAIEAVRNINLVMNEGEVVTILGPNGAGKTTTMEALMGMLSFSGEVRYCGEHIERWGVTDRVRHGLTLIPESRDLFSDMTVRDNLVLGAFSRHLPRERDTQEELDSIYSIFPRLKERERQLAGTLSGGERQMLAIGRALMLKPRLLMLDEPSLGLAPLIVVEVFNIIGRLKSHGVSVLLVEQNARAALAIADRAYVLETGSIVQEGPAEHLSQDPRLTEIYLGLKS